ncbi:unnamed protein product [Rotaria sp. Silwood1]|nr:unnamed protein product [Rotaria sp. Silwood1]
MGNCSTSSSVELPTTEPQQNQTENHTRNDNEINVYLERAKQEFEAKYTQSSKQIIKLEDFQLERTIGMGVFGRVMLAKYENKTLALKIMEKQSIVELGQVEHILSEKRILQAINFPFIVSLVYSFKDNAHLYLALEFASGGEMFGFSPFQDEDPMKIYTNILRGTFNIPEHFSSDLIDLIHKLLHCHPAKRYGNLRNGVNDIKNHPWFSSIDWIDLFKKRIKAPYVPEADKDHYETYEENQLTHAETNLYPTEFDSF